MIIWSTHSTRLQPLTKLSGYLQITNTSNIIISDIIHVFWSVNWSITGIETKALCKWKNAQFPNIFIPNHALEKYYTWYESSLPTKIPLTVSSSTMHIIYKTMYKVESSIYPLGAQSDVKDVKNRTCMRVQNVNSHKKSWKNIQQPPKCTTYGDITPCSVINVRRPARAQKAIAHSSYTGKAKQKDTTQLCQSFS